MTVAELVKKSLRIGNIVDAAETLDAVELENGRDALNSMLYRWSVSPNGIHSVTRESFNLTAGDGEYSIGATGDFVTTRPTRILSAFIRFGTTDYPLKEIATEDYAMRSLKSTQAIPYELYVNPTHPNATLILWPIPDQIYALHLDSQKPLAQYSTTSETITLPPEYEDALKWNLHIDLCPEYGKEPSSVAVMRADQSYKALQRLHARPMRKMDARPFSQNGRTYDITGDIHL